MITFTKTDKTCSNSYLIDETLCLSNTLEVINYNTVSLSAAIFNIGKYDQTWKGLYTIFTTYSSKWIKTATNIQQFSANWLSMATTVNSLSSTWQREFTVYYPQMLDINNWNGLSTNNQNQILTSWLNNNFSPYKNNPNQLISVVVYLNQQYPFAFTFNRSYKENCIPNGGGASVSCSGCPKPYQGCNHHGGAAGVGPCTNLFDACYVSRTQSIPDPVSCVGSGGKFLNIGLSRQATEINTARVIKLKFQNINRVWTNIS
jgi:hypothetical protein